MSKGNYTFMSIFCISPILCFFIIILNILIPVSGTQSESFAIKAVHLNKGFIINQGDLSYIDKKELFAELENDKSYSIRSRILSENERYDSITINYHYGLTGLKVFESNSFVKNKP